MASPGFIVAREHLRHDFYTQRKAADEHFAVGVAVHFAGCIGVLLEDFFFFVVQPGKQIVLVSDHQCQHFFARAVFFDVYLAGIDVAVPEFFEDAHGFTSADKMRERLCVRRGLEQNRSWG